MGGKCEVCGKDKVGNRFCELHELAYSNLTEGYEAWRKAYGQISFQSFLKEILKLKESGEAVKEVASYLLNRQPENGR